MEKDQLLNRRHFFKLGSGGLLTKSVNSDSAIPTDSAVPPKKKIILKTHIRPPGALDELDFLSTCTRCFKCIEACPYDAIDTVSFDQDDIKNDTPFISVFDNPCHYCEDMPCIAACEPKALVGEKKYMTMGEVLFDSTHCLIALGQYCDYCFKACPKGISAIKKGQNGQPEFDSDACVGCGKCAYICVSQSGKAITMVPVQALNDGPTRDSP